MPDVAVAVAVVGAGVGGLAAALRLGAAGHDVVLLERLDEVGGKLARRRLDGFTFDTGPSLLTLPGVFDDLLRLAGTSLAEAVDLVRLDPICRYRWADGTAWDHRADRAAARAEVERAVPGAGAAFDAFLDHARTIWETAERTFFAGTMGSPLELARRLRSPRDLLAIDPLRSLDARARAGFGDGSPLVRWVDRYATYSGSSPARAPATLACIPWIEQAFGAWYVRGGLHGLAEALLAACRRVGVEVRTGADVEAVRADTERVHGVRLAGGERIDADVVVANVDATHLYADLLPDAKALRRTLRAEASTSGFALLVDVAGQPAGAHHTVAFGPGDYLAEFDGRLPEDPTVYVADASVSDDSVAPAGHRNWFVLVNVPPAPAVDWDAEADRYRDVVLDALHRRGLLTGTARVLDVITPDDLARRYRAWRGSIYGTSSDGRRAAFLRPGNRGSRRGLYLVGGSSHPGGGLPLVALSGRIVADLVAHDHP